MRHRRDWPAFYHRQYHCRTVSQTDTDIQTRQTQTIPVHYDTGDKTIATASAGDSIARQYHFGDSIVSSCITDRPQTDARQTKTASFRDRQRFRCIAISVTVSQTDYCDRHHRQTQTDTDRHRDRRTETDMHALQTRQTQH
jgi:hypothetical protein